MDQKRFDNLTRTLASGSSRRKVLGGALAGIGAGLASLTGIAAQGKKRKKRKGRVGAEFTCSATNANNPALGGCSDPDSCCASTAGGLGPICVTEGTQLSGTQQFCGKLGNPNRGSGVCRTCPPGTVCSLDSDNELRWIAPPTTGPTGCWNTNDLTDQDDTCVPNGSGAPVNSVNPQFDGNSVCGFGGSECTVCSLGTIFAGCCTATGACNAGTTGISCGSGGRLCEACTAGNNCINQTCETTAPCGPATCGQGCCNAAGACLNGTSNNACGEGGVACTACGAGQICQNHECVAEPPDCPTGQTLCSGVCVNLQSDPNNCGACGTVCARGCQNGTCKKKKMMMMMMN
jgi:hypothetical protein